MNARPEIISDHASAAFLEASAWRQLTESTDIKTFCTAWLALECGAIAGAASGIVMLPGDEPVAA